jgi:glycerophosphoryl diester phosphodiesterase
MAKTLITAHSGADQTPENSIEFIQYALQSTADALEIDINRNASGMLVLSHDTPEDSDSTNKNTYPEVSLEQAFLLLAKAPRLQINCDLKQHGMEAEVARLAEQFSLTDRLLFSGSVSPDALHVLPKDLSGHVLLNIEEFVPDLYENCTKNHDFVQEAARKIAEICFYHHIPVINAYYQIATDDFIRIIQEQNLNLSLWTVNDSGEIKKFLQKNLFNITTRNCREACKIRDTLL